MPHVRRTFGKRIANFFYLTYHTVIFLDYYLSRPVKEFNPILPYRLVDPKNLPFNAIDDVIPTGFYSKDDFVNYLLAIRSKCKRLISLTPSDQFGQVWIDADEIDLHGLCPRVVAQYNLLEILFYNLRHVQHHIGQLNLILRQEADMAVEWISLVE